MTIVKINQLRAEQILNEYPQLHKGECEAIAFMQDAGGESDCIVSDDLKARKIFQMLNFKGTERWLDIMREEGMIDEETYVSKSFKLRLCILLERKIMTTCLEIETLSNDNNRSLLKIKELD